MRTVLRLLIGLLCLLPSLATAQVTLTDPQNAVWDIDATYYGFVYDGTSDAYDNWPSLCVLTNQTSTAVCTTAERYSAGGAAYTTELGGRQLVLGVKSIAGLTVWRKVFVPSGGGVGFARYMEFLKNSSGTPITVKARVGSTTSPPAIVVAESLGSEGSTVITGASDGTTTLKAGLTWFNTDDGTDGGGDPSLSHVVGGPGASIPMGFVQQSAYGRSADFIFWEYRNLTIAPGKTAILLHFESQQPNRSSTQTISTYLTALPENATQGMTTEELSQVVNFKIVLRPVAEANGPYTVNEGSPVTVSAAGSYARSGNLTTYEWDCRNDGTYEISTTATTAACTYPVHGTYTASLRVTDSNGSTATDTATVTVENLAPSIASLVVANPGFEGDTVEFSVTASDPGPSDPLTYAWNFGDGGTGSGTAPTHVYVDEGTFSVSVTVTDSAGASASQTTTVQVANARPVIASLGIPASSTEGASVSMTASATDRGVNDILTYTWAFGDGTSRSGVDLQSVSHTYTQNGTYTVTLTVADNDGDQVSTSRQITVTNVEPSIASLSCTASGPEGSTFSCTVSASDPGADTLSYAWDFGDGGTGSGSTTTHVFTDEGSYTVKVTVTDPDGGAAGASTTVSVSNVAPTLVSLAGDETGLEGASLSYAASATDPGADTLSYAWDFGDGGTATGSSVNHAFADNGVYTITVVVSDDSGDEAEGSLSVVVSNVSPKISSLSGDFSGIQGQLLAFEAAAQDPGTDTLTYAWNFGDGSSPAKGVNLTQVSHAYKVSQAYTLTLTVTDEDGGQTSTTRTVNVGNGAPAVSSLSGDAQGEEGSSLAFTASAVDPGGDTLTYAWDFGDGTAPATGVDLTSLSHTYADDGTYQLELTVTDIGGLTASTTLEVQVSNVAPTLVAMLGPEKGPQGIPLSFEADAFDPGDQASLTYTWDFGDGSPTEEGLVVSHTYYQVGVYNVTLLVSDGDGGTAFGKISVDVENQDPTLEPLAGPTALDEGQAGTWSATASDAGGGTLLYVWDFGDGTQASTPTVTHAYAQEGTYTLSLLVVDENGAAVSQSLQITVTNLAPTVSSFVVPESVPQGADFTLVVSANDAGQDPLTYAWTLGDASTASTPTVTHRYYSTGTYPVSVTVTDDAGASVSRSAQIVVTNLEPEIEVFSVDSTGSEASPLGASYAATDASGREPSARLDWGDGRVETIAEGTIVYHSYADNGLYQVTLTVTDLDGASASTSQEVEVANLEPVIEAFQATSFGAEGETLSFQAQASDPAGSADPLTYVWDFGDGSSPVSGLDLTSTSHAYQQKGVYTLRLTVSDDDGGSTTRTASVNVDTAAPVVVKFEGDSAGDEGSTLRFSAQAADPVDQALSWQWDFGDGSAPLEGTDLTDVTHLFADDGRFEVRLTVTDPDGLTASQSLEVRVANLPPQILSEAPTSALEGQLYSYALTVSDPAGEADPLTFALEEGPEGMTLDELGLITWTPSLAQAEVGAFAVGVTVEDGDGGSARQVWTILLSTVDSDGDGMPDSWEQLYGLDAQDPADAAGDLDEDGQTNLEEYQAGTDPASSNAPGAPSLVSPVGGEEVPSLTPTLVVGEAADPDQDVLEYELEVYADPSLSQLLTQGTVAAEPGETDWTVDVSLPDNADAYWRARARDAHAFGPWSEVGLFFVNPANDPPTAPSPSLPLDGAMVGSPSPILEVTNASDPDRQALTYTFEVYGAEVEAGSVAVASGVKEGEGGTTQWKVPVKLAEDGLYQWRVKATDALGLEGEWSVWSTFSVSGDNGAPSAPTFLSPLEGEVVDSLQPTLEVSLCSDPENDPLAYQLQLDSLETFDSSAFQESGPVAVDEEGRVRWTPEVALEDNQTYYARALADDGASTSAWVTIRFQVNAQNDAPLAPTLENPSDGSRVEEGELHLSLVNTTDPDGDALTYTFLVLQEGGQEVWRQAEVQAHDSGFTAVDVSTETLGGPGEYRWTAFAVDTWGLEGASAEANRFTVLGDGPVETPTPEPTPGDDDDQTSPPGDDDDPTDDPSSCACDTSRPAAPTGGSLVLACLGIAVLTRRRRQS